MHKEFDLFKLCSSLSQIVTACILHDFLFCEIYATFTWSIGLFQKKSKQVVWGWGYTFLKNPWNFNVFTLILEIPDTKQSSVLDIPQNCVRFLGNSKAKIKDWFLLKFDWYFHTSIPEGGGIFHVVILKLNSFWTTCGYVSEILWIFLTFSSDYFLGEKKKFFFFEKIKLFEKVKHFYTGDTECNLEF